MPHRRHLLRAALPCVVLATARPTAAATGEGAPQSGRLRVVASFSILGDMVRQIGGARVDLRVIVGPDRDAHGFQPRPSDVAALGGDPLVVRNGLGFEPWLDRLLGAAGHRGPVVTATAGITPRAWDARSHEHRQAGGERRRPPPAPDPHAWQDLRLGQSYVRTIAAGLAAADPAGTAHYRAGAEGYAARLAALDAWVRERIATVPEARRKVVTHHAAFGYFGAAYGVRFLAPQGVPADAEPSAAEVARLIRQIRAEGITAVFLENMTNPATLQRLAREAGVRVGGRLYADALSPPDGPAPTYEAMFRHNVGLLVPAMRGDAA
ncbi:metal ABC transporter solute-binding protein, Zn/Mn family [Caldovatus aquaticus]|uniref:Zinc ABC transporter substrate-binding protein n=1 Tax=Caldovatus aquaticus TaxID=2865671 RepID=A0ABS7F6K2_9PROT|nr:zinc ABC transporter substrate-binding protein [Caldovatus aquaticus]MBW8271199.1 zinc ABC transporter substrate-binding protein [Caldovatus aquaticus]